MPTSEYNMDVPISVLRTTLTQHNIPSGKVEEICGDYERQLSSSWRNQNVQPEKFNELFQTGQTRSAQQQNR